MQSGTRSNSKEPRAEDGSAICRNSRTGGRCQLRSAPDDLVDIRGDMLLLCTAISSEGDRIKTPRNRYEQVSLNCNDVIQVKFQNTNDECIVILQILTENKETKWAIATGGEFVMAASQDK